MKLKDNVEFNKLCSKLGLVGADVSWKEILKDMEFNGDISSIIQVNGKLNIRELLQGQHCIDFNNLCMDRAGGVAQVFKDYIKVYADGVEVEKGKLVFYNLFYFDRLEASYKSNEYTFEEIVEIIGHNLDGVANNILTRWLETIDMTVRGYSSSCIEIDEFSIRLYRKIKDYKNYNIIKRYLKGYKKGTALVFKAGNSLWVIPGIRTDNRSISDQMQWLKLSRNKNDMNVIMNAVIKRVNVAYRIDMESRHGSIELSSDGEPKGGGYALIILDIKEDGSIIENGTLKLGHKSYKW